MWLQMSFSENCLLVYKFYLPLRNVFGQIIWFRENVLLRMLVYKWTGLLVNEHGLFFIRPVESVYLLTQRQTAQSRWLWRWTLIRTEPALCRPRFFLQNLLMSGRCSSGHTKLAPPRRTFVRLIQYYKEDIQCGMFGDCWVETATSGHILHCSIFHSPYLSWPASELQWPCAHKPWMCLNSECWCWK